LELQRGVVEDVQAEAKARGRVVVVVLVVAEEVGEVEASAVDLPGRNFLSHYGSH
jgi:hypothetical protein